jgi:hypothetical protein
VWTIEAAWSDMRYQESKAGIHEDNQENHSILQAKRLFL